MIEDIVDVDMFEEWHKYLAKIRDLIARGIVTIGAELSDYDLAITYVTGIAYEIGYKVLTPDMIFHMLKAFTDVDTKED